jgi:hypothetical protein
MFVEPIRTGTTYENSAAFNNHGSEIDFLIALYACSTLERLFAKAAVENDEIEFRLFFFQVPQ